MTTSPRRSLRRSAAVLALCASSAATSCGAGGGAAPDQDAAVAGDDSALGPADSSLDAPGDAPADAGATDGPAGGDAGGQPGDASAGIPPCPAQPPAEGGACTAGQACAYVDCATYGHVSADCYGALWTVHSASCAPDGGWVACRDDHGNPVQTTCASNQVCSVYYAGAVIVQCVNNTCPPGLVSCSCIDCASFRCHVTSSQLTCGGACGGCL